MERKQQAALAAKDVRDSVAAALEYADDGLFQAAAVVLSQAAEIARRAAAQQDGGGNG